VSPVEVENLLPHSLRLLAAGPYHDWLDPAAGRLKIRDELLLLDLRRPAPARHPTLTRVSIGRKQVAAWGSSLCDLPNPVG